MILTPITALISSDVSPALIANVIEHAGVFCEDRFGNVSFHHADSPMAQGILEGLELILAADRAGEQHAAASADEESAYWELSHSGWPRDKVPNFKAFEAVRAKALKRESRDKKETGLLMIIAAQQNFIEMGADLKTPHPDFESRTKLIDRLADQDWRTGLSRRNLQKRFAEAKLVWETAS